jgi:hypothetical protein
MHDTKKFQIEITPSTKRKKSFKGAKIAFNAISIRTKPVGNENIYTFSAGGITFRIFSGKVIKGFKTPLKDYVIILK